MCYYISILFPYSTHVTSFVTLLHTSTCCISPPRERLCVRRADGQCILCCHPYYSQACDMSVPRGMGTEEESYQATSLPLSLPLVGVASICFICRSWLLFPQDPWRNRGGVCCASNSYGPSGEKSVCCWHLCSPGLLSDCAGQWEVGNGCLVQTVMLCLCVSNLCKSFP